MVVVAVGVVVCQWLNLEYSFPKVWATIARIGERWSLFSPQDMILLLNTCQEDIIQRSKMFKRILHVQSPVHKNNYEDLLTQIVLCEYSGLTKCNVETFTAILKFQKIYSTAVLLQKRSSSKFCISQPWLTNKHSYYIRKITWSVSGNIPQVLLNSSRLRLNC